MSLNEKEICKKYSSFKHKEPHFAIFFGFCTFFAITNPQTTPTAAAVAEKRNIKYK